MEKYKNKYRTKSHRMPGWDYSANAMYFITIVTQHRDCKLGEIIIDINGRAYQRLSDYGKIVKNEFLQSFEIRNELFLTDYIIMPNHIHAIIVLNNTELIDGMVNVETHGRASLHDNPNPTTIPKIKRNPPIRQPKSISSFIAGFKSAVNTKIDNYIDENDLDTPKYNKKNHFFQPNYHDHIIRNEKEYQNISDYIKNNPAKWKGDRFNANSV